MEPMIRTPFGARRVLAGSSVPLRAEGFTPSQSTPVASHTAAAHRQSHPQI
jgi:hypothetical protein